MKKFLFLMIFMVASTFVFAEPNWWEIDEPVVEKTSTRPTATLKEVSYSSGVYYILTLEISQSHFSLDLTEHLKDAVNKLTIEIPVDKDYYDSVQIGKEIADNFRIGSLVFKGSIGKWKVKVINKKVVNK